VDETNGMCRVIKKQMCFCYTAAELHSIPKNEADQMVEVYEDAEELVLTE